MPKHDEPKTADNPVVSLAEHRFNKEAYADQSTHVDMLRTMIARIERGDFEPDHMIVAYSYHSDDKNECYSGYCQSGSFNTYAAEGLLIRVARMVGPG